MPGGTADRKSDIEATDRFSNDCVNCRGHQESEAKGILIECFLIERRIEGGWLDVQSNLEYL